MKRLLAALAGLLGLAWLRSRSAPTHARPDVQPDPADALRAKLAEAREADEAGSAVGQAADARPAEDGGADEVPDEVDARRRDVHERTRRRIDDLRS